MKLRVIIEPDEDGFFVATCPNLPGCISQGKTRQEALANITEAMQAYVESLTKHGDPVPPPITEELVEIRKGSAWDLMADAIGKCDDDFMADRDQPAAAEERKPLGGRKGKRA